MYPQPKFWKSARSAIYNPETYLLQKLLYRSHITHDTISFLSIISAMPNPNVYENFAWQETTAGTWVRDVDEAELYYYHIARAYEGSGRICFGITGHLTLSIAKPENCTYETMASRVDDALRRGWLQLRFDCPTIASLVVYDERTARVRKQYKVFSDDNTPDAWLAQTFQFITTGQTGAEWCNSDPPAPALPTLFLIIPAAANPGTSSNIVRRDLVLRAPHDVIDGVGTIHLLNKLIANAANAFDNHMDATLAANFGAEVKNLSPPLRVAACIAPSLSWLQMARLPQIAMQHMKVRAGVEVASIPFKRGALLPAKHQREAILLSVEQTGAILAACRGIGVTVTHAFHAAAALAIRDRQERRPKPRKVRYINNILANERSRCQGEYGTAMHAAAVYHSSPYRSLYVDMTVPALGCTVDSTTKKQEFLETVVQMSAFYSLVRHDSRDIDFIPLVWSKARLPWSPSLDGTLPSVPEPDASPSVSMSSLGLIDRILQPNHSCFKIFNPWITGEELSNGLGLFLGTFLGQLELSCAYNEAWHSSSEIRSYLKDCWQIVQDSFEVCI